MTGSTSSTREFTMSRSVTRHNAGGEPARTVGWQISRIKDLFRRQPARRLPPLPNAHYIAVHMAAAKPKGALR
ncbi:hypothetical protein [Rhodospirillaceae bacterium SYSU D60014]|uniref:hypothetical protein n=1 Tax=Virgifigura deserti TaxID=2268457 RepID=UPI000E672B12